MGRATQYLEEFSGIKKWTTTTFMESNSLLVVNVPSKVSFMDHNRDHMIIKHIHSNCHSWRIILCLVLEMSEFRCDAEILTFLSLILSLPSLSLIHGNINSWRELIRAIPKVPVRKLDREYIRKLHAVPVGWNSRLNVAPIEWNEYLLKQKPLNARIQ